MRIQCNAQARGEQADVSAPLSGGETSHVRWARNIGTIARTGAAAGMAIGGRINYTADHFCSV
jgi:hypothetical protein